MVARIACSRTYRVDVRESRGHGTGRGTGGARIAWMRANRVDDVRESARDDVCESALPAPLSWRTSLATLASLRERERERKEESRGHGTGDGRQRGGARRAPMREVHRQERQEEERKRG